MIPKGPSADAGRPSRQGGTAPPTSDPEPIGSDRSSPSASSDPSSRPAQRSGALRGEGIDSRLGRLASGVGRTLVAAVVLVAGALAVVVVWDAYVTAPWTRDGRVRVQVANIAPQVSGQIVEVKVTDNQLVHVGDVLYVIDTFDFQRSLDQAEAQVQMRAADLSVKQKESQRRMSLSALATTPEQQQIYEGNALMAQAELTSALAQRSQAEINLRRTSVRSTVNGYVTNLLLRVGDYAVEGSFSVSVIDADSFWIDGYFEETKLANVSVGDHVTAKLVGYDAPILGVVETLTRGISVSDAASGTQGLPNVNAIYTWVRLAQRIPVRIRITEVPAGVPLVSGMTATVSVVGVGSDTWLVRGRHALGKVRDRLAGYLAF